MDFIYIIFRAFIFRIIGAFSRYVFYSLIGNKKEFKELLGDKSLDGGLSQDFFNIIIGIPITIFFLVTIAYMIYS